MDASTLSRLLFLMVLALKVHSQNTSFAINAFTSNSLRLTYERGAFVPPDETYVRLTEVNNFTGGPLINSVGRVLYKEPVHFWGPSRQASFDTTITLQMTSRSGIVPGHGMTFFIVPVNSTLPTGGVGRYLGLYNALVPGSPFFAVEFDLYYRNSQYDPPYSHLGININSEGSQNTSRFYTTSIVDRRVTLHITYDAPSRRISVVATSPAITLRTTYVFNLKMLLPRQVQLGLSATTDGNVAFYDVSSWHFNSNMVPDVNS